MYSAVATAGSGVRQREKKKSKCYLFTSLTLNTRTLFWNLFLCNLEWTAVFAGLGNGSKIGEMTHIWHNTIMSKGNRYYATSTNALKTRGHPIVVREDLFFSLSIASQINS